MLATAVLTTGAAGVATGGTSGCDPMYPCYSDDTPAAVYDLSVRTGDAAQDQTDASPLPALSATGLGGEQFEDHPHYRDGGNPGAAVYDLAMRTDDAPCESYPCYVDEVPPASATAVADKVTGRSVEPRS
jgi:hypothetical protein